MAPRNAGGGARFGDAPGEDGVAVEAFGFVELAGVDVGLAGVAGGVDQEGGLIGAKGGGERRGIGVINLGALEVTERDTLLREKRLVSLANVAGTAEEVNHGKIGVPNESASRWRNKAFQGRKKAATRVGRRLVLDVTKKTQRSAMVVEVPTRTPLAILKNTLVLS